MAGALLPDPHAESPERYTRAVLDWLPWVEPLAEGELDTVHLDALVVRSRARNPYFRLLVRDPATLLERTRIDKDILTNPAAGLPRGDREFAATVASRTNGCVYCASVHAAQAVRLSGRSEEVDAFLAEGIDAEILDERWAAIAEAVQALTTTPVGFVADHVQTLRDVGLGDDAILDVVLSGAFFNWANRLMLSLGEPTSIPANDVRE